MHEVLQKLLASYRLQGVPDDLSQVQCSWFTRWWQFSCYVAGLVNDEDVVRALARLLPIPVAADIFAGRKPPVATYLPSRLLNQCGKVPFAWQD